MHDSRQQSLVDGPEIVDPMSLDALDRWLADVVRRAGAAEVAPTQHMYGEHPQQVGDLWLPAGPGPFSTVVLLHGGGFLSRYSRRIMDANAIDLVRRGFAVWAPEYRRTDADGGPRRTTADVDAAVGHVRELGDQLDLERMIVVGHSAGGFLALWAAHHPAVSRVIALGAVCDLRVNAVAAGDGYVEFMGGLAENIPQEYDFLDLARRPVPRADQVLVCGLLDQPHRLEENRRHAAMTIERGGRATLVELPQTGHFAFLDPRSGGWLKVIEVIEDMGLAPSGAGTATNPR